MTPLARLGFSLVLSLVLWVPTMQACLDGDVDVVTAGLRYLAGLLFAWLGVGVISRLISGYVAVNARAREEGDGDPEAERPLPRRRRDDDGPLPTTAGEPARAD